jgi:hypothetical protein
MSAVLPVGTPPCPLFPEYIKKALKDRGHTPPTVSAVPGPEGMGPEHLSTKFAYIIFVTFITGLCELVRMASK